MLNYLIVDKIQDGGLAEVYTLGVLSGVVSG